MWTICIWESAKASQSNQPARPRAWQMPREAPALGTAGATEDSHQTRETPQRSSLCTSFDGRPGLSFVQETHSLVLVIVPACTTLMNHPLCPTNRARAEGRSAGNLGPLRRWRHLLGTEDGKTEMCHGLKSPPKYKARASERSPISVAPGTGVPTRV